MLSILIPIYNYNCLELVKSLNKQALELDIKYEILAIDDCSSISFPDNREINLLDNCTYTELDKNIGRSCIRNRLADMAQYNNLLFIDCDSKIVSEYFLQRYLSFVKEQNIVVCGGRLYASEPPSDKKLFLHWLYGSKREVIPAAKRQRNPYHSFMSNNFLISKMLFNQIRFNEKISTYGHEDSLFGYEIKKRNATIYHTDNPLIHTGLETASTILKKERDSIKNLILISENFVDKKELANDIKLLKYALKIDKSHLTGFLVFIFNLFNNLICKNIQSNSPSLFLLDIYKLGYFCQQQSAQKR
ncbi:MAG: glycosyltransferase [Paludibacteraceae bacterium]|nr:glycosyltransferase [Paludibacteraceae bacterium]